MLEYLLCSAFFILFQENSAISFQAKCSVECYMKCILAGTPDAAYCNCDIKNDKNRCNMVNEAMIKGELINEIMPVKTDYVDAHHIRIVTGVVKEAFIYVFEFSTISTSSDEWRFAGLSNSPEIIFAIPDPCRDYQFRMIVLIRSTDPQRIMLVYRPRAIPPNLPQFAIRNENIETEKTDFITEEKTVVVYVRWKNPDGYKDSDIYGYEGPAIYPIQCDSPEEELPMPSVEIFNGGGRLRLSLPSNVLKTKCRLWVEVRMLPRCVRLEAFNIQRSIELDCEMFRSSLSLCRQDVVPQCIEIIDVWGYHDNVTLMWAAVDKSYGKPLHYLIRYGPAEIQVVTPFVTWKITSLHEIKVPGNTSSINLSVDENVVYGVQICGIYSNSKPSPKFELSRVTPFSCKSCNTNATDDSHNSCESCSKIEKPPVFARRCHPIGGKGCVSAPHSTGTGQIATIGSITEKHREPKLGQIEKLTELVLDYPKETVENSSLIVRLTEGTLDLDLDFKQGITTISSFTHPQIQHSKIFAPDRSNIVQHRNKTWASDESAATIRTTISKFLTVESSSESPRTRNITEIEKTTTTAASTDTHGRYNESLSSFGQMTTNAGSASNVHLTRFSDSSVRGKGSTSPASTISIDDHKLFDQITTSTVVSIYSFSKPFSETPPKLNHISLSERKFDTTIRIEDTKIAKTGKVTVNSTEPYNDVKNKNEIIPDIVNEVHQQRNKGCHLYNGVICDFGCMSESSCLCPSDSHLILSNGGCIVKNSLVSTPHCFSKLTVNATWDPKLRVLLISSQEIAEEIKQVNWADKLFIEFGEAKHAAATISKNGVDLRMEGIVFNGPSETRSKMVIRTDKILRYGLFSKSPFTFYVNRSVDPLMNSYALRTCLFNSSKTKNPFVKNWDFDDANKQNINSQVLQLSLINFDSSTLQNVALANQRTLSDFLLVIAPVFIFIILIVLIVMLMFVNCSRIKRFYDRRRTRKFHPFILNTSAALYPYSQHEGITASQSYFVSKNQY